MPDYVPVGSAQLATMLLTRLTVQERATIDSLALGSVDGLTARAGGGQASATLIPEVVARVGTVATAADSVKLPPAEAGLVVCLVNGHATNSMQVFGSGTDTINDVATATGVSQAAGKAAIYFCPVAGKWYLVLGA